MDHTTTTPRRVSGRSSNRSPTPHGRPNWDRNAYTGGGGLPASAGTADATARRRAGLRRPIHTAGLRRPMGPAAAEGRRRAFRGWCSESAPWCSWRLPRASGSYIVNKSTQQFPDHPRHQHPEHPRAVPSMPSDAGHAWSDRPRPRPGGQLSVAGMGENKTLECNDSRVSISGVSNTVTITGHCTNVTVSGMQNKVTARHVRPDQRVGLRQRGHLPLRLTGHQLTPETTWSSRAERSARRSWRRSWDR